MIARSPNYMVGLFCGLAVPFIWGAWIVTSRFGVTQSMTAYDITALRVGVGSLIVLPIMLKYGFSGLSLYRGFIISIGAGAPFALASFTGMAIAPVAHAGVFTNGSLPIFTAIFGFFWLSEKPGYKRIFAIATLVLGGVILASESVTQAYVASQFFGDLLLILAGAIFALYLTTLRKWQPEIIQTIVVVPVISAVIYLPIWLFFLPSDLLHGNTFPPWQEFALQAGFQGAIASVLVVILLTKATKSISPTTIAVFLSAAPALAVILGVFILYELPTKLEWIGLTITTIGMLLAIDRKPIA
jgi:drug/metabolite transporter (DMT)-like permease|tara:strand:- start:2954 stop:3853 length:900 start_codon:yes stop_codon:yes gene_type:complete